MELKVICLEEPAFHALIDQVVARIKATQNITQDKWLSPEEAMRRLNIASRTTLQTLRDEGKIRFTQPERKHILYDADSINQYLEKNVKEPFR